MKNMLHLNAGVISMEFEEIKLPLSRDCHYIAVGTSGTNPGLSEEQCPHRLWKSKRRNMPKSLISDLFPLQKALVGA